MTDATSWIERERGELKRPRDDSWKHATATEDVLRPERVVEVDPGGIIRSVDPVGANLSITPLGSLGWECRLTGGQPKLMRGG
jgi:hypothetical protein